MHGISQARIVEWVAIPFSGDLPNPGIEFTSPASPALQADYLFFFNAELLGKPCIRFRATIIQNDLISMYLIIICKDLIVKHSNILSFYVEMNEGVRGGTMFNPAHLHALVITYIFKYCLPIFFFFKIFIGV